MFWCSNYIIEIWTQYITNDTHDHLLIFANDTFPGGFLVLSFMRLYLFDKLMFKIFDSLQ